MLFLSFLVLWLTPSTSSSFHKCAGRILSLNKISGNHYFFYEVFAVSFGVGIVSLRLGCFNLSSAIITSTGNMTMIGKLSNFFSTNPTPFSSRMPLSCHLDEAMVSNANDLEHHIRLHSGKIALIVFSDQPALWAIKGGRMNASSVDFGLQMFGTTSIRKDDSWRAPFHPNCTQTYIKKFHRTVHFLLRTPATTTDPNIYLLLHRLLSLILIALNI